MLRALFERYSSRPPVQRAETTRRRSITFSPSRSATVVLRARVPAPSETVVLAASA